MNNLLMKKIVPLLFSLLLANVALAEGAKSEKSYPRFPRLTTEQLHELANPTRMSRRIFYEKLSVGSHAKWFDAVKTGNLKQVKLMAERGQDLEVRDEASLGETALGWAAYIGYLDIVEYLVGKGANLYAPDGADVTHVLKSAIAGGNVHVIEYLYPLMKDKVDLNEQDISDDETVLMMTIDADRLGAMKWLLNQKVDVNIFSDYLDTDALGMACHKKNAEMIKLLIEHGAINRKTGKPTCN